MIIIIEKNKLEICSGHCATNVFVIVASHITRILQRILFLPGHSFIVFIVRGMWMIVLFYLNMMHQKSFLSILNEYKSRLYIKIIIHARSVTRLRISERMQLQ